jgi:hypothetical protein
LFQFSKLKIRLDNENLIGFFFGVCLFLLSKPYIMWGTGRLDMFLGFIISLISLYNIRKFSKTELVAISLFIIYVIYAAATQYNIFGIITKLVIIPFLLINRKATLIYFKWFKNIFVLSLLISLIVYVAVVFFSIPIGYNLISPLNEGKGLNYIQYPFLVSERLLGFNYYNIRFCGMFDEPGVVGTLTIIILFAERFNLRSKQNIILLIAGLLSFSLYFYIVGLVYYLAFSKGKYRLSMVFLFIVFYLFTSQYVLVNKLIWSRFTIENGKLSGDSRSSEMLDNTYDKLLVSNDLLWGKGIKYAFDYADGSASFKLVVIAYGLVFLVVVLMAFSIFAYCNIRQQKYLNAYLLFFIGMLYNRWGFIFDPARFFMMIACIYAINLTVLETKGKTNVKTKHDNLGSSEITPFISPKA